MPQRKAKIAEDSRVETFFNAPFLRGKGYVNLTDGG